MATDFRLKEQLPRLTERIVATYTEVGSINHLGHCPLPSYDEIIEAIDDLKDILFPGYRRREGLHIGNVTYHVGDLIDGLHDKLTRQIARALRHDDRVVHKGVGCEDDVDYEAKGQAMAITFLERLPEIRRIAGDRCPSGLRRRSRLPQHRRSDLLLSGAGSDHRPSPGPRAATARRAVHSRA